MLTRSLLQEARATVHHTFQGNEHFSCLTGSILDNKPPDLASDIDIVVVLPNGMPTADAVRLRIEFTRRYIDLHRSYSRMPDLSWPGEVLYIDDLKRALEGAVFESLGYAYEPPPLCSLDLPYRYWISMIATGRALTGTRAFIYYAERCADLIAWHKATYTRNLRLDDIYTTMQQSWKDEWQLPPPSLETRMYRVLGHLKYRTDLQYYSLRCKNGSGEIPPLEERADQWRSIAHKHLRDLEHACKGPARDPADTRQETRLWTLS